MPSSKVCERCAKPIPDTYVNTLCDEHYAALLREQTEAQIAAKEHMTTEALKNPDSPLHKVDTIEPAPEAPQDVKIEPETHETPGDGRKFGIKDEGYRENPEADDKDQILANLAQFIYSHDTKKGRKGKLLWYPQRNMYNYIRNYCMERVMGHPQYPKYIWKPMIVDVGCGSGVGSNVLSQEASFVWGIDKNEWSIEFAQEAFTREKNGQYYSNQLTFDCIDIMTDTRDFLKFDIVVAIEVIEHVYDTEKFLKTLIQKFTKRDKRGNCKIQEKTEFFFSSPNRNFHKLQKDTPANPFHVREWRAEELFEYLETFFENVEIMNQKGEPVEKNTAADEVVFYKCWHPKV